MGASMLQLSQIAALRASSRWTMRAQSPAGTRPPCRSRPSWFFKVQMIASTRWRSQLGKTSGSGSSVRAGRIRHRPHSANNAWVAWPDRPLSVTTAEPLGGRLAGWWVSSCRACSRSPHSLGWPSRTRSRCHQQYRSA
jgi:hypothetical protein